MPYKEWLKVLGLSGKTSGNASNIRRIDTRKWKYLRQQTIKFK